jgi:hypothetical protein
VRSRCISCVTASGSQNSGQQRDKTQCKNRLSSHFCFPVSTHCTTTLMQPSPTSSVSVESLYKCRTLLRSLGHAPVFLFATFFLFLIAEERYSTTSDALPPESAPSFPSHLLEHWQPRRSAPDAPLLLFFKSASRIQSVFRRSRCLLVDTPMSVGSWERSDDSIRTTASKARRRRLPFAVPSMFSARFFLSLPRAEYFDSQPSP